MSDCVKYLMISYAFIRHLRCPLMSLAPSAWGAGGREPAGLEALHKSSGSASSSGRSLEMFCPFWLHDLILMLR